MAQLSQSPTLLDLIPGARAGISYLLSQVAIFQRIPLRLNEAERKAIAIKRAAEAKGDIVSSTKAALLLQGIGSLRSKQVVTGGRLADVLDQLRITGLAATPVELGALAVRVAGEVSAILNATKATEASLNSLGGIVLTQQERDQLNVQPAGATANMSNIGKYVLYGGIAYLGYYFIVSGKAKGTRRF